MKKSLIIVFCTIALCSLLVVPLLPQPELPTSQSTPQPTPQSTLQPTPQYTLQPTPQNTLQPTPQSTPQPTPQSTSQPATRTLQSAVGNASSFLEGTSEPYALLMLNVVYRRFGIAFADSLQRYDQVLAEKPQNAPLLRVFRRIADYDNPLQAGDMLAVSAEVDCITVPALYFDRQELRNNYLEMLNDAASSGGYMLTHALLATIWIQENGGAVPDSFTEPLYHANAELIGGDPVVTDLELEAATFLYLAGQGSMVDNAFVYSVISAQNNDGGWLFSSDTPGNSEWHPTVLGLLLLLHVEYPAASYPPMLAPASGPEVLSLNPAGGVFPLAACVLLMSPSRDNQKIEEGLLFALLPKTSCSLENPYRWWSSLGWCVGCNPKRRVTSPTTSSLFSYE